ncbi:MAG: hypothetical protein ACOYI2_11325 [Bacillota bacterium]|jgi:hypothetical protein|nr:hypothetical protein [Clostridia bacterium]
MSLVAFGHIKLIIQLIGFAFFFYAVYRKYFRHERKRLYRTLIGTSIVIIFGIEFLGEVFIPGFSVSGTPRLLRIGLFCYGLFLIFIEEKELFH